MRYFTKLSLGFLILTICAVSSGCRDTKKSSATSRNSTLISGKSNSSLDKYSEAQPAKKTYSNIDADSQIQNWLDSAQQFIFVVDSTAPSWILDYLRKLKQTKPYLTIYYASDKNYNTQKYYFYRHVPDLRTSYILVDRQRVILNPLYESSSKGITYVVTSPAIVADYHSYTTWLTGIELQ